MLARCDEFADLGRPVVVGPSRKSFLARPITQRVARGRRRVAHGGGRAAAVLAGAHIVRVHAVREMAQVVRVADEIRKYHREPMSDWLQTVLRRPPIEWMDLLDIAIVAVFFYQVLLLIRGTRADADGRRRRDW